MLNELLNVDAEDDAAVVRPTDEVDISVMQEINRVTFCIIRDTRRREVRLWGSGWPMVRRV